MEVERGPGVAADSGVPLSCREAGKVAMIRRWIKSLVRRQRIARFRQREVERELRDERGVAHLERARQGIKDIPGPAGAP
jgi:hypothetical protein